MLQLLSQFVEGVQMVRQQRQLQLGFLSIHQGAVCENKMQLAKVIHITQKVKEKWQNIIRKLKKNFKNLVLLKTNRMAK